MPVVLNLTCLYCIYHDSVFSICTSSFLQDFCMSEELMEKMKWQNCCLLGSEPEPQLHSHGSVLSSWLPAGQGGRTQFHAQAQGERLDSYYVETSVHPYLRIVIDASAVCMLFQVRLLILYSFPLQEQDVTEASSHIVHLTGRLRDLETSLSERQSQEKKLLKDLEENKKRYREGKRENLQLNGKIMERKLVHFNMQIGIECNVFWDESLHQASVLVIVDQLKQQLTQSSMQREEIIRLKQERQLLHRDLLLSGPVHFDIRNPHLALPVSESCLWKCKFHLISCCLYSAFFVFVKKNNIWSINRRNVQPDFFKCSVK